MFLISAYLNDIYTGLMTVATGMKVTIRQMFRPTVTMHYPDERWEMPRAFRGLLKCDVETCIVCYQCAKACPVDCIIIEGEKRPDQGKGIFCTRFEIDYSKCMFCGLCTEPCPTEAIFHSHEYEIAAYGRQDCIIEWTDFKVRNPWVTDEAKKELAKTRGTPAPKKGGAAPAAAATATAEAPAHAPAPATAELVKPKPGQGIVRAWVEPGCIVCDLCSATAPDVFALNDETSYVVENANYALANTDNIVKAAVECPVNVIKYELKPV